MIIINSQLYATCRLSQSKCNFNLLLPCSKFSVTPIAYKYIFFDLAFRSLCSDTSLSVWYINYHRIRYLPIKIDNSLFPEYTSILPCLSLHLLLPSNFTLLKFTPVLCMAWTSYFGLNLLCKTNKFTFLCFEF